MTNEMEKMLQSPPTHVGELGYPHGCSSAPSLAALLVYRVFRHEAKRSTKALHALLHGLALLIALIGERWDQGDMGLDVSPVVTRSWTCPWC